MTRPRSIVAVGILFIAAGTLGLAYHARDIKLQGPIDYEALWVLFLRVLVVVTGVFILRGADWARYLAMAWLAYHVTLSVFHSVSETLTHVILLAVVGYVLFRSKAAPFFEPTSSRYDVHQTPS